MPIDQKELLDYAWKWFEYHATQRLIAFRFFLVFLGILIIGYNNGIESGNLVLASFVAGAGALVSFAFLMLEVRNERLVDVGRNALRKIESVEFPQVDEFKVLSMGRPRHPLYSHKVWLRLIYMACIAVFLLSAFKPDAFVAEPKEPAKLTNPEVPPNKTLERTAEPS